MATGRIGGLLALAALGLLLSSCGSGNRNAGALLTQTTLQRSLSTPTETAASETTTAAAPTTTVVPEPATTTILVTTTTQQVVTVSLTETVAVTEPAPPPVTTTTTTTTTVNPAAAAAAGAAIASQNTEATATASNAQWGWIAFGILAAGVIGGAIWWLIKRHAPKTAA